MLRVIAIVVAMSSAALAFDDEPTDVERQIIDEAVRCPNAKSVGPWLVWQMLEAEETAGVPQSLRGLIVAAACTESGFYARARGDCKAGRCRARGVLQLWPWWSRRYRIDRDDPMQSARAWLAHIVRQIPKTRRVCSRVKGRDVWLVAQVRAIRSAGQKRCTQRSLHWKRLKRWQRRIKKS